MKKMVFLLSAVIGLIVFGCEGSDDADTGSVQGLITETYTREPYRLELSYPAGEIDFGSTAEFFLRIEYPENESYILLPPAVDNLEKYSNTIIDGIAENEPVLNGNGTSVSIIIFNVEAWLPGELVFPPLAVSFGEVLSTEQIVIPVRSAFDGGEGPHVLSPLYVPDYSKTSVSIIFIIAGAAVMLTGAAAAVFLFLRRRKRNSSAVSPEKTRDELIMDFRKNYIETEENIDLRAAFTSFERIPGTLNTDRYRRLMNEARFSRDGVPADEGRRVLTELYLQLVMEGSDEL